MPARTGRVDRGRSGGDSTSSNQKATPTATSTTASGRTSQASRATASTAAGVRQATTLPMNIRRKPRAAHQLRVTAAPVGKPIDGPTTSETRASEVDSAVPSPDRPMARPRRPAQARLSRRRRTEEPPRPRIAGRARTSGGTTTSTPSSTAGAAPRTATAARAISTRGRPSAAPAVTASGDAGRTPRSRPARRTRAGSPGEGLWTEKIVFPHLSHAPFILGRRGALLHRRLGTAPRNAYLTLRRRVIQKKSSTTAMKPQK